MMIEYKRQTIHILFGLGIISLIFLLGRDWAAIVVTLFMLFLVFYSTNESFFSSVKKFFITSFERKGATNFNGAINYLVGCLIAITFTNNINYSIVLIGVLAFGDGLSTVIGLNGTKKILWNSKKTMLGTLAFVTSAFIVSSIFLNLYQAVVLSIFLGFIETLSLFYDDNLLIPIFGVMLLSVI